MKMLQRLKIVSISLNSVSYSHCNYLSINKQTFYNADFMFPKGHNQMDMKVCGEHMVKAFCKDYTEKVEMMFIFATVASVLVILSLVSRIYFQCTVLSRIILVSGGQKF